jgi:hypothetical protein
MKKKVDTMAASAISTTPAVPSETVSVPTSQVPVELLRKYSSPKPTMQPQKTTTPVRLSNAKLRELAKTHKPPQSWFDNDEEGLY